MHRNSVLNDIQRYNNKSTCCEELRRILAVIQANNGDVDHYAQQTCQFAIFYLHGDDHVIVHLCPLLTESQLSFGTRMFVLITPTTILHVILYQEQSNNKCRF